MNVQQIGRMMVGLVVFSTPSCPLAQAGGMLEDAKEDLISLGPVGSPRELSIRIQTLLSSAQTSELDRLVTAPNCTVALAAGWERVCRTLPEAKQDVAIGLDRQAVSRFLGLLEGRIQFAIPKSWEASVTAARGRSQRQISFPRPNVADRTLTAEVEWTRLGGLLIVKPNSEQIKLPAEDGSAGIGFAAVELAGERAYVAQCDWPPGPYKLFAIDRASGKVLWSSKVWAAGGFTAYSGPGWHDVFLRSTSETVVVFGNVGTAVYVEAFNSRTGQNRYRFSTANFDRLSPRESSSDKARTARKKR